MKEDIYNLLNHIDNDLSEYEEVTLSEFEKTQLMKQFNHSPNTAKKRQRTIRAAGIAAAGLLVIGGIFYKDVYAAVRSAAYALNFLEDKDLEEYKTIVNMPVTDKGYTITLSEVILDRDEIIVAMTVKSKHKIDRSMIYINGDMTVTANGIRIASGGYGQNAHRIDDYTFDVVASFALNGLDNVEQELEIDFNVSTISAYNQEENVRGDWSFRFKADGIQLAQQTKSIPLDELITLNDGQRIRLTEYTSNELGEKIYFEIASDAFSTENKYLGLRHHIIIEGEDNLGNPIYFDAGGSDSTGGKLVSMEPLRRISPDAAEATLTILSKRDIAVDDFLNDIMNGSIDNNSGTENIHETGVSVTEPTAVSSEDDEYEKVGEITIKLK